MHPAGSVVAFTTASGAGYGFVAALALHALFGGAMPGPIGAFLFFAVGFALIIGGLLASTFHLGRPERAWRAFSQWRTSWLSREGVLAVFFFAPGGLFGLLAMFWPAGLATPLGRLLLVLVATTAAATVFATAMIYAQLKAVPAWRTALTPIAFLALAAASGASLLCAVLALAGLPRGSETMMAMACLAIGLVAKALYWLRQGRVMSTSTTSTATGLGRADTVRLLDAPHTEANYLMREMGFRVARQHARKLRIGATILGFMLPMLLLWLGGFGNGAYAGSAAPLAFLAMMAGLVCERWLFFAEAKHVVTLFYGTARI